MLRNKEIFLLLIAVAAITLLSAIAAALFISPSASVLVVVVCLLLMIIFMLFTRWRYRELEKLSSYLRQIASGNYKLDVRDNVEGELSILKNDIYKVTMKLSEHSELLKQDKRQLLDAISDISHQLKTPLTSMLVMVDLLADAELPITKRKEFTRNITKQLERIDWLISSLLKLSKIDAGTVRFKRDEIQVEGLIRKAIEPLLIPIDIKGLTVTIDGNIQAVIVGDLNWTAEALINILKNGIEHTPEGGAISIAYKENALYTEIVVADNGKGINKEDLPYIFKRFYRGKQASEGSIGIGLAMAHSIITSQNGTIEVVSQPGEGTTFMIKFYKGII